MRKQLTLQGVGAAAGAVIGVLVTLVVGGLLLWILQPLSGGPVSLKATATSAPFNEEIIKSFKISSLTYYYSDVLYEGKTIQFLGADVPLTTTRLGVRYDGVMEIGIDASKIEIVQSGPIVTVTLPPAEILSHTIVPGSTEVLFDVDTPFAKNRVDAYTEHFDEAQARMEQRAVDRGQLTLAAKWAKEQLQSFLDAIPGANGSYTIVIREDEGN